MIREINTASNKRKLAQFKLNANIIKNDLDLSTYCQYVETIAESMINGQFKQAKEQFKYALDDGCGATALLIALHEIIDDAETVITLAGSIISDSN